ncbi:MAG: hypothetical protein EHM23_23490 [Acidobacteria bacterium]|nr:MAG: hypothetical protein EHM23_23490 [Acidobacteriota bacterium]
MLKTLLSLVLLWVLILSHSVTARAQILEGGVHGDFSLIAADSPLGTEKDFGFGVWAVLWPTPGKRWAIAGDWALIPRNSYTFNTADSHLLGESERNRQYVDVTLQYYLKLRDRTSFFLEAGGGAFWNNSQIVNPRGDARFPPQGPDHQRIGMWTVGGGFRQRVVPHLYWVAEMKYHNPGRDARNGGRFFTGLVVGF